MLIDPDEIRVAVQEALGAFFDPVPSNVLFERINDNAIPPTAVVVPANPAAIVIVDEVIDVTRGPFFFKGFATSSTNLDVIYTVMINGQPIFRCPSQPTAGLFVLYPLRQEIAKGPARLTVTGTSTTGGNVAGVYARIAGYTIAGSGIARRRMIRSA